MWTDVINTAVGGVIGLASGFYFERRSSRAAREHTAELERELAILRASIYTVGGNATTERIPLSKDGGGSLAAAIRKRAVQTQDASGRTSRTQLVSHFCGLGHRKNDVDEAIGALCADGQLFADGKWLEVR
ncbi:MAG: hypothetical protein EKK51_07595 [Mycolicibacterium sp.]|uniref:hypothetical protein n=1 Tax=Mycolicibacterium sp. TaxID=2320850 RepID=UPI000F93D634|nr:hypothetical protein [Mycolicibacterium sp.]RUP32973.1 MAG: hypothetical protein EKK51_07595 [Mycolicibacterium sp.]